jgi:hypothetical protein
MLHPYGRHHCKTMSLLFVFLDGVGLAPAGPHNPFATIPMPGLYAVLAGPLTLESAQRRDGFLLRPINATLGIPGLPQSGTGQLSMLAGVNAAALHGRHQPHFPPVALRPLLAEQSVLRAARQRGARVAFANAFSPGFWQALATRRIRRSASLVAAEGAELRLRDLEDLAAGRALSWDLTNVSFQNQGEGATIPVITPAQAARNLVALAAEFDLLFFESFLTDLAGHGRLNSELSTVLAAIDAFLSTLIGALRPQDTLLLTSDHGNIEDSSTPGHTRNPVPLLVIGPAAAHFTSVSDLVGVKAAILAALDLL